jgi:hypothetical protein
MNMDIDPLANAEVYIAYGRTEQAKEILRKAIEFHPERAAEFQAKLKEIEENRAVVDPSKKFPKPFFVLIFGGFLLNVIGAFGNVWFERLGWFMIFAAAAGIGLWWLRMVKPK